MDETKLRSLVQDLLKPVFDSITDNTCTFVKHISANLPTSMPVEKQNEIVTNVLNSYSSTIKTSFEGAIPKDFEERLKEAMKNDGTNR